MPVFTAHPDRGQAPDGPDQARAHHRRRCTARLRAAPTPEEAERAARRGLREELVSLWQTRGDARLPPRRCWTRSGTASTTSRRTLFDLAPEIGRAARARPASQHYPGSLRRAALPALRELDRRRPRRQPVRDRRRDRGDAARAPASWRCGCCGAGSTACTGTSASTERIGVLPELLASLRARRRAFPERGAAPRRALSAAAVPPEAGASSTASSGPRSRRARGPGAPTSCRVPGTYRDADAVPGRPAPDAGEPARRTAARAWPRAGSAR